MAFLSELTIALHYPVAHFDAWYLPDHRVLANSYAFVCVKNVRFPTDSLTKRGILFEPELHEIFAHNAWPKLQWGNAEYFCHDKPLFEC